MAAGRDEIDCCFDDDAQMAWGYYKRGSIESVAGLLLADNRTSANGNAGWGRMRRVYINGPAYGGLSGSARGFGLFLSDQLRAKSALFSDDIKAHFYSTQVNNRGDVIPMTLGWRRGQLSASCYFGKPGGGPGFQSNVRIYHERGIATVMLANRMGLIEAAIDRLTDKFDRVLLED